MDKKRIITAAVAAFAAGTIATAVQAQGSGTIKCSGANACKGQSACKGAKNSCKGQNACKGQGYVNTGSTIECTVLKSK